MCKLLRGTLQCKYRFRRMAKDMKNTITSGKVMKFIFIVALLANFSIISCQSDVDGLKDDVITKNTELESKNSEPVFPDVVSPDTPLHKPGDVPEELKTIWEVWELLVRHHVDKNEIDPSEITEAAIRGMLLPLEDPQTAYVSKEYLTTQTQDLEGSFEGIGATVSMRLDGKF